MSQSHVYSLPPICRSGAGAQNPALCFKPAEPHLDRKNGDSARITIRTRLCRNWSQARSYISFRQMRNRPYKLNADTVVLFHVTPCAFHVNILLCRKFSSDPITGRVASSAVLVDPSQKSSYQIPADRAIHFCPYGSAESTSAVIVQKIQKMPAISIAVMRTPWRECSRLKSWRKVNPVACGSLVSLSEQSAIGTSPAFLDQGWLFSKSAVRQLGGSCF